MRDARDARRNTAHATSTATATATTTATTATAGLAAALLIGARARVGGAEGPAVGEAVYANSGVEGTHTHTVDMLVLQNSLTPAIQYPLDASFLSPAMPKMLLPPYVQLEHVAPV